MLLKTRESTLQTETQMDSYTRLGTYLLTTELATDPVGKLHRGLTIFGSALDKHFLVRSFTEEVVNAGLGNNSEEIHRAASNLAGARDYPDSFNFAGGKSPLVASD